MSPTRTNLSEGRQLLLLVDDDNALREALADQLRQVEEYDCREAETGAAALDLANKERFDGVLLDVGLPDVDGREVCRSMRRTGISSPIIMLTAADSDADTILGLESGANDDIAKPFRIGVLLARLRAQLRQHEHSDGAALTIGPYCFLPGAKLLIDQDSRRKIYLTHREAAVLRYLYHARGGVTPHQALLQDVWGYNAGVTTHTVETHIYRLRQKLEPNPCQAKILVTVPGGYRLVI